MKTSTMGAVAGALLVGLGVFTLTGSSSPGSATPEKELAAGSCIEITAQSPWSSTRSPVLLCRLDGNKVAPATVSRDAYLKLWRSIEEAGAWNLGSVFGENRDIPIYHIRLQCGTRSHTFAIGSYSGEGPLFAAGSDKGLEKIRSGPYRKVIAALREATGISL